MAASSTVVQAMEDIIHFQRDATALRELVTKHSLQDLLSTNFLNGYSPLTSAIMWNAPSIVKVLTQEFHVDIKFPDKWGRTPLHHAAVYKRPTILVHLLMVDYARTCDDPSVAEYIGSCVEHGICSAGTTYENKDDQEDESYQRRVFPIMGEDDDAEEDVEISPQQQLRIVPIKRFIARRKSVEIYLENESKDVEENFGKQPPKMQQETGCADGETTPLSARGKADQPSSGFMRWFERSFYTKKGNVWESYLRKCIANGFDSLQFWFDVMKLNEIGHRNQEKFQLQNILKEWIGMKNDRHVSMFIKHIQKELYSRSLLRWLTCEVGLVQYLELFLENGFSDMEDLMNEEITDELLLGMGVESPAHRFKLLMHILLVQGTASRPSSPRDVIEAAGVDVRVPVGGFNHRSLGTVY